MAEYLTYTVARGDTLSKIATKSGVAFAELVRLNNLSNPDLIKPGQILNLKRTTSATYTVRKGDTLSLIAAHYNVSVASLIAANGISDPDVLSVGQVLTIPALTTETVLHPAIQEKVAAGVPQPGALALLAAKIARASVLPKSAGKCYRYVKRALLKAGAVDHYLEGDRAVVAGPILAANGFVDILPLSGAKIGSPYDAPAGAVLVYKASRDAVDVNRIYGHIEIRTADGFASDYFSVNARTGARANGLCGVGRAGRTLFGVWVKPDKSAPPVVESGAAPAVAPTSAAGSDSYAIDNLKLSSVNGKYQAAIAEAAALSGIAPQVLAAIIEAEAAKRKDVPGQWDANSKAPGSSAAGLMQFTTDTWIGEAKTSGRWLNGECRARGLINQSGTVSDQSALLQLRYDARCSIMAGSELAKAGLATLRAKGFSIAIPVSEPFPDFSALTMASMLEPRPEMRMTMRFMAAGSVAMLRESPLPVDQPPCTSCDPASSPACAPPARCTWATTTAP